MLLSVLERWPELKKLANSPKKTIQHHVQKLICPFMVRDFFYQYAYCVSCYTMNIAPKDKVSAEIGGCTDYQNNRDGS